MTIRIARVLAPVTALGPGRRVGVWVQGCTLSCQGCASQDTWDPDAGTELTEDACAELLYRMLGEDPELSGLSLTGGEPLQQSASLTTVLRKLRTQRPDVDVMMFTGYAFGHARRTASDLIDLVDLVVTGRYVPQAGYGGPLRASANQQTHALTVRGAELLEAANAQAPTVQVAAIDGDLVLIGTPAPGDLHRLQDRLAERGITFGDVTWRA